MSEINNAEDVSIAALSVPETLPITNDPALAPGEHLTEMIDIGDDNDGLVTKVTKNLSLEGEEARTDMYLKRQTFWFIVGMISVETLGVIFLPYVKWFDPNFVVDEWALRLLIVGMLAQPYLILQIITKYLFSSR